MNTPPTKITSIAITKHFRPDQDIFAHVQYCLLALSGRNFTEKEAARMLGITLPRARDWLLNLTRRQHRHVTMHTVYDERDTFVSRSFRLADDWFMRPRATGPCKVCKRRLTPVCHHWYL